MKQSKVNNDKESPMSLFLQIKDLKPKMDQTNIRLISLNVGNMWFPGNLKLQETLVNCRENNCDICCLTEPCINMSNKSARERIYTNKREIWPNTNINIVCSKDSSTKELKFGGSGIIIGPELSSRIGKTKPEE